MLKLVAAEDMEFQSVREYYEAFDNKRELNSISLRRVEKGEEEYNSCRNSYEKIMYYLIDDEKPKYIIGIGSIEDSGVYDFHKDYLNIGNIGYGVRPNERNKGYGTIILKLLLKKCEERGMGEVCVSCKKDNIASKRVILKNNGKFDREFFDDWEGHGLKFWIKLKPKLSSRIRRMINSNKSR